MRTPTPSRLAILCVTVALVCSAPVGAQAGTRSVPATGVVAVAVKDTPALSNDDVETALMVEINAARAAQGLRKIWNFDVCTDALAEQWGTRIARTGIFEHRDQSEIIRKCRTSWAGETLVRGVNLSPKDMVDLWLDSPGHREILMSPRARRAGVAIVEDSQGRTIGVVNLVRPH